nr:hypothetical protein [Candidatus Gracilibacteria bacterium]
MSKSIEKQKQSPETQKVNSETPKKLASLSTEILSEEVLSNIESKDFLKIPRVQRLKYVTKSNKEYSDVKEGDNIEFTFTFGKKYNYRLYLKTTAGQLLPSDVREVKSNGVTFSRNGLYGEFFDKKGNRLVIHEGTNINILKSSNEETIKLVEENIKNIEKSGIKSGDKNYDLALFSTERGLDAGTSVILFSDSLDTVKKEDRNVEAEVMITNLERQKAYFIDDYPSLSFEKDGKLTPEFLTYFINQTEKDEQKRKDLVKKLGIDSNLLEKYSRTQRSLNYKGYRKFEELSQEEKNEIGKIDVKKLESFKVESFGKQFIPGSKEAQELFTYAAILAGLPAIWGQDKRLHDILRNESKGVVGVANYIMDRNQKSSQELKKFAIDAREISGESIASAFGVYSTATGLGQLTMSNEKYLPSGRESIGVPVDEAIGMLRYIDDRYGSVEVASNMYGKTGSYVHSKTGREMLKQFKEGY